MTARRRRGAVLVAALHDAALAEVAAVGVEAMTMESVAARAGAGKASLYQRWPSTHELLLDALAATDSDFSAERERFATATDLDLREALVEVLTLFAGGLDTPAGRALHAVMAGRAEHPELVERLLRVMVTPRQRLLRSVLDRAVATGLVRAEVVTPTIVGAGPRLVIAQHSLTGRVGHEDVVAVVDEILLPALTR